MLKIQRLWVVAVLLCLGTILLFWRATHFGFVEYDDPQYVTQNPIVQNGITSGGIKWALFSAYASNWHPVTWISHMADCMLFGLKPGWHHATNILLHGLNSALLFLVLLAAMQRSETSNSKLRTSGKLQASKFEHQSDPATSENSQLSTHSGAKRRPDPSGFSTTTAPERSEVPIYRDQLFLWPSALIAALFAVHPLHVESVAWISERKDVLSAFFFLLSVWAYVRYAQLSRPSPVHSSRFEVRDSEFYYWMGLVFFALALMSKPMVVTLPFVLLLLDFWPLDRFGLSPESRDVPICRETLNSLRSEATSRFIGKRSTNLWELIQEKVPFFILTIFACALTVWAQRTDAMSTLAQVPLGNRLSNAVVSYALYLWKMAWPHPLAPLYPYREWAIWQVAAAACLLVVISWAVLKQLYRRPYLAVGWFWYLGTMVPVVGVVQVGIHSMADRYMYVPSIGIFVMIVFGIQGVCASFRIKRRDGDAAEIPSKPMPMAIAGLLAGVAVLVFACMTYLQLGIWKDSVSLFSHVVAVTKNNLRAEYNLGVALQKVGRIEDAIAHYRRAVAIKPTPLDVRAKTQGQAHLNLAIAFAEREDWAAAANEFRAVLVLDAGSSQARAGLAGSLIGLGQYDEAVRECQAAINLNAQDPALWRWMGIALADIGKGEEAFRAFQEAVRLNPNGPIELNELAWFWATCPNDVLRNGSGAVALAQRACELTNWQEPRCVGTLDAAYAEAGSFAEALDTAHRAAELARAKGNMKLAAAAEERAKRYAEGKPWRQKTASN